MNIEAKVMKVKDKIISILNERELSMTQYTSTACTSFTEEEIEDQKTNLERLSTQLLGKIPANIYRGIEEDYIVLEGKELKTSNARSDVHSFYQLFLQATDHINERKGLRGNRARITFSVRKYVERRLEGLTRPRKYEIVTDISRRIAQEVGAPKAKTQLEEAEKAIRRL
jgi:hypothetical protein